VVLLVHHKGHKEHEGGAPLSGGVSEPVTGPDSNAARESFQRASRAILLINREDDAAGHQLSHPVSESKMLKG
jgi:ABC-type branched-subunit amino acid transport system substrate-binding protein